MPRRQKLSELLLPLAAPLFTLALFLWFLPHPRYALIYGDPDYAYFTNGMLTLRGEPPHWVDHPGTPVQELAALVTLVRWWLMGKEASLETDFFLHSFLVHRVAVLAVLAFFLAAQAWAGRELRRQGYSWWLAVLVQLTPLLFFETHAYLRRLTPETPLAIASLLLVPVLARAREKTAGPWTPVAAGMLLGFAGSLKAVAFPLGLLFFLLPAWRARGLAALSALFFYVNFTAPIWYMYPFMAEWYVSLLVNRGSYGQQGTELFSLGLVQESLAQLAGDNRVRPLLAWLPAFLVLPWLRASWPRWPLLLTLGVYGVLTLKHPEPRYLTPLIALLGLAFLRARALPVKAQALLCVAVLAASGWMSWRPLQWASKWLSSEASASVKIEALLEREPGCHVSLIGPVPIRVFTLMSGDRATPAQTFGQEFGKLFPRFTFINQSYMTPSRWIDRAEWERIAYAYPCILLVGRTENAGETFRQLFGVTPVVREVVEERYAVFTFPEELRNRPSGQMKKR